MAIIQANLDIKQRYTVAVSTVSVSSTVSPYVYLQEDITVQNTAITDCSLLARPIRLRSHPIRHSSRAPPGCTCRSDTGIDLHDMLSMQSSSQTRSSVQSITL